MYYVAVKIARTRPEPPDCALLQGMHRISVRTDSKTVNIAAYQFHGIRPLRDIRPILSPVHPY